MYSLTILRAENRAALLLIATFIDLTQSCGTPLSASCNKAV
jgi:hypothetical protein